MMESDAELEGLYRFLGNKKVHPEGLMSPHFERTAERARATPRCLVIHDTSEINFKRTTPPEEMGFTRLKQRGFFLHASIAVAQNAPNLPLGLLAVEFLHRPEGKRPHVDSQKRALEDDNESLRWMRGVRAAAKALGEHPQVVHVMDREGDDYKIFHNMVEEEQSFVIRIQHNRRVDDEAQEVSKVFDSLELQPSVATREVQLSKRSPSLFARQRKIHPARESRMAALEVRFTEVDVLRPTSAPASHAPSLKLQVVHVFEPNPPEGEAPIDWKLITNLPVSTGEGALDVVDIYRQRWIIEEYFKALKTGTQLYSRQMEGRHAIHNVVALSLPLAWRLLVLRAHARRHPNEPATTLLTALQLTILRTLGRRRLTDEPTLEEATYAIAALAGHLKRNGPPGWQTLAGGLQQLFLMEKAWTAAIGH